MTTTSRVAILIIPKTKRPNAPMHSKQFLMLLTQQGPEKQQHDQFPQHLIPWTQEQVAKSFKNPTIIVRKIGPTNCSPTRIYVNFSFSVESVSSFSNLLYSSIANERRELIQVCINSTPPRSFLVKQSTGFAPKIENRGWLNHKKYLKS